jgi:hypothetical protein
MPRHRLIFAIDLHRSGNSPCKCGTQLFAPVTGKTLHNAAAFPQRTPSASLTRLMLTARQALKDCFGGNYRLLNPRIDCCR